MLAVDIETNRILQTDPSSSVVMCDLEESKLSHIYTDL